MLLAAELLTLNVLPLSNIGAEAKRTRIRTVLSWMARPVEVPPLVDVAFDHGAFSGGVGFNVQIWKMLDLLIRFVGYWRGLPEADAEAAFDDPWTWKRLVMAAPGPNMPAQREALLYLVHPTVFLPIVKVEHKRAIRAAFASEVAESTGDIDRDLLQITLALQADQREPVRYYKPPFVERWKPAAAPDVQERRAWLVRGSSVHGYNVVSTWLQEGWVSLSASMLMPVEPGVDKATLKLHVDEDYAGRPAAARAEKVTEFHNFLTRMRAGDIVATTRGGELYLGVLTSDPEFTDSEKQLSNLRRRVDWWSGGKPIGFHELPEPLPTRLSSQSDVVELTDERAQLEELMGEAHEPQPPELSFPAATSELADELFLDQAWLQDVIDSLWDRRQLIFYGPPGTGKTFVAQRLARHLTDLNAVKLVQFHPSYSYEDFFEGYRPVPGQDGKLGFELRWGPFRKLVEAARSDPATPYVLIIDEINRANLAKVFGEMYFLLEYRDRSIGLLYSEGADDFTLPKNVFLIGTMNTADRSIALVDAAMRRRFAFVPLHPADEPVKGLLRRWLERHELPAEAAGLLEALNSRMKDADFAIGPSYFMRPGIYANGGLERVWRTSIMPLLEELHYGEATDLPGTYGLGALRKTLAVAVPPAEAAEPFDQP
jgi:5-methylcytosine-specific restriction protein B